MSKVTVDRSVRLECMMDDYQVWVDRGMPESRMFRRDQTMHQQIERWGVYVRLHPRSRATLKEEYDHYTNELLR